MLYLRAEIKRIVEGHTQSDKTTWRYFCPECSQEFFFKFTTPLFCTKCGRRLITVSKIIEEKPTYRLDYFFNRLDRL